MEEQNKNMEEFIRKALDGFDESPKNAIWDAIDQRFIDEQPFYKKFFNWKFIAFGIILLILASSNLILLRKTQNQDLLIEKLSKIEATLDNGNGNGNENRNGNGNDNFNTHSNHAVGGNRVKSPDNFSIGASKNAQKDYQYAESLKYKREQNRITKSNKQEKNKLDNVENLSTIAKEVNPFDSQQVNEKSIGTEPIQYLINQASPIVRNNKDTKEAKVGLHTRIKTLNLRPAKKLTLSKLSLPRLKVHKIPIIDKNGRFLFGFNTGAFFAFTDQKTKALPSYSAGLNMEFQLNKNLSISSALQYNYQQYQFNKPTLIELINIPNSEGIENIMELEITSTYLDLPIGLILKKGINPKTSLIINPAVAWQFYFPQNFEFSTSAGI